MQTKKTSNNLRQPQVCRGHSGSSEKKQSLPSPSMKNLVTQITTFFLSPILYLQGKQIRKKVPILPEAANPEGYINPKKPASEKETLPHKTIISIGESTIAGVGVINHQDGFTAALANEIAKKLDTTIHWKVYARSGYTAKHIAKRTLKKIEEQNIDLIVIGLGGNDAFTLSSLKKWNKHINQIITTLRSNHPKTPIVFLNMPPIKEFPAFTKIIKLTIGSWVEMLGRSLKQTIKQHNNVHYNSLVIRLKDWIHKVPGPIKANTFFSDGVHPSQLTYKLWAEETAHFIFRNNIL